MKGLNHPVHIASWIRSQARKSEKLATVDYAQTNNGRLEVIEVAVFFSQFGIKRKYLRLFIASPGG